MPIDMKAIFDAIPLIVGAVKPGSPTATGLMQGYQQAEERRRQQAIQEAQQQSQLQTADLQRQLLQAQIANLPLQHAGQVAGRMNDYRSLMKNTVSDLVNQSEPPSAMPAAPMPAASLLTQTPNANPDSPGMRSLSEATNLQEDLLRQKFNAGQDFGVTPDAAMPNVARLLSERDKKVLDANLKKAESDPIYKDLVGTPAFEQMTIQIRSGQQIPVSEARRQIGGSLNNPTTGRPVPPSKAESGSETERAAALLQQISEATDPDAKRALQAKYDRLLKAKRDIGRADDKPADPALADINRQLAQIKLESEQQKLTDAQGKAADAKRVEDLKRTTATRLADDMTGVIDELLDPKTGRLTPGAQSIVGMRVPFAADVPGSDAANAKAALDRLVGQQVIDLMTEMKSQSKTGATGFGQLSEKELALLQASATKLANRNMSDRAFATELKRLRDKIQLVYQGQPSQSGASDDALSILEQRRKGR